MFKTPSKKFSEASIRSTTTHLIWKTSGSSSGPTIGSFPINAVTSLRTSLMRLAISFTITSSWAFASKLARPFPAASSLNVSCAADTWLWNSVSELDAPC